MRVRVAKKVVSPRAPPLRKLLCPLLSNTPNCFHAMLIRNGRRSILTLRPPISSLYRRSIFPPQFPTSSRPLLPLPLRSLHLQLAHFHSSPPRKDVLFVSAPMLKQSLLYVVRITLLIIPFLWRYKLFRKYPKHTRMLLWVPLAAISLVVALGLDQSERTSRWRLLLMSEREEMEWSNQR